MFFVMTLAIPIIVFFPIVKLFRIVELEPICVFLLIVTFPPNTAPEAI